MPSFADVIHNHLGNTGRAPGCQSSILHLVSTAGQAIYEAAQFGPYAVNLRHVLVRLEGHYLQGYGDGQDSPIKPILLLPTATEEAREFLKAHDDVAQRLDLVAKLIDGFEDSFGLELLSTVHWIIKHNPGCAESLELTIAKVRSWNSRKARMFSNDQILSAWNHLHDHYWTVGSETSVH